MSCLFHLSLELQYFGKIQTIDVKLAKDCSLQSLKVELVLFKMALSRRAARIVIARNLQD